MTMLDTAVATMDEAATRAHAHLFDALSEPTRLEVLQHLALGEHRVRDLVGHVGLAQSTVSRHLQFLLECGLVVARPEGRATWYSLSHPHATSALVKAAEALLAETGTHAALSAHLRNPQRTATSGQEKH